MSFKALIENSISIEFHIEIVVLFYIILIINVFYGAVHWNFYICEPTIVVAAVVQKMYNESS